ncbi:helix-turn-helix transcriptional regulator [Serratia sp. T13T92]|uniref:helix-turn-helix transcriptional regulator n=1 Tax=Serratia sp. T13T92 TaxID=3397496 RepID=UPI0039E1F268
MKNQPINNQLVDMKFLCKHSGLSRAYFYKLIANGLFPKPLKFGRASRWQNGDYLELLSELEAKRSSGPAQTC